ncbi:unnamed protein product, partial [Phaeothamnion confervicola]
MGVAATVGPGRPWRAGMPPPSPPQQQQPPPLPPPQQQQQAHLVQQRSQSAPVIPTVRVVARLTKDDLELQEMEDRLNSGRQFHTVINEIGKRIGKTNGPIVQHKLDVLAIDMIDIRKLFHPHTVQRVLLTMVALFLSFCYQVYMYHTGHFNLYVASLLFGYFTKKFVKKRGRAAFLGLREALRNKQLIKELKMAGRAGVQATSRTSKRLSMAIKTATGLARWRKRANEFSPAAAAPLPSQPPAPGGAVAAKGGHIGAAAAAIRAAAATEAAAGAAAQSLRGSLPASAIPATESAPHPHHTAASLWPAAAAAARRG